jgi:hypothetical protein
MRTAKRALPNGFQKEKKFKLSRAVGRTERTGVHRVPWRETKSKM